jgi:hypothetical protein
LDSGGGEAAPGIQKNSECGEQEKAPYIQFRKKKKSHKIRDF